MKSHNTTRRSAWWKTLGATLGAMTFASVAHAQGGMKPVAAPDLTVRGLDGSTANLSSYRGRPIVLSLWATWCPSCREHMPVLESAYQRFGRQGLVILAISNEDSSTIAQYARANNFSFPLVRGTDESVKAYSSGYIPQTYFIDSSGRVTWQKTALSVNDGPLLEAIIARDLRNAQNNSTSTNRRAPIASAKRGGYGREIVQTETIRRETIGGTRSRSATSQRPIARSTKAQRAAWARAQKAKTKTAKRTRQSVWAEAKRVAPKSQTMGEVLLLGEDGIAVVR